MAESEAPRTVIRSPAGPERGDIFAGLARPLLKLATTTARDPNPDPEAIAREARTRVEAFETSALRAGLPREAIGSARDALLAVLAARAGSNPAMPPRAWTRALQRRLPGTPIPDADLIAGHAEEAARSAADQDLARFLRHCSEAVRAAHPARAAEPPPWGLIVPLAVCLTLAAWTGWAEWRYAGRLLSGLPAPEVIIATAGGGPAEAARTLDRTRRVVDEIAARAGGGPLGLAPLLGARAPGAIARARYAAVVDHLLPPLLAAALSEALASEGKSVEAYDTLRARAILDGASPWQPEFLTGWMEARASGDRLLGDLAPHAAALSGPHATLPAPDPPLVDQARQIAAEGTPADYAFLELTRDPAARALPGWSATSIPGLSDILVSRSGQPVATPVPGLFTRAGWTYAGADGARRTIDRASREWLTVTRTPLPAIVPEAAVMARLRDATLTVWTEKLADFRVRPFTDQAGALLVSGTLGQPRSPLETLFRATWTEVGGTDRDRSAADQMAIDVAFGATIRFAEAGEMVAISQLFAGLNIELRSIDRDEDQRLMNIQSRAVSIATLDRAPRLVTQIVEDVLAQAAATRADARKSHAARRWSGELLISCRVALDGYPFSPEATDADLDEVRAFLRPDGALGRFVAADLATLLDTSASPWSWRPQARLSGYTSESAAFLERALDAGGALFPETGGGFTAAVLARTGAGATTTMIGGTRADIDATETLATLAWPGPQPSAGARILLTAEVAADWPGPWGLLRLIDDAHVRARDDGKRFLLDLRVSDQRIFMELMFPSPLNPIAAQPSIPGLVCPRAL